MSLDYLEYLAAFLSIIAVTASGVSWFWERSGRKKIQLDHRRRIWGEISKVRGLMADLEKDGEEVQVSPGVNQAVGKLTFMYRDLLREAIVLETKPSISTIILWRKTGKLGSDWQQQLALSMLLSEELDEKKLDSFPNSYQAWDELPVDHAHSAKFNNK